eukprot:1153088-Pelagomonas_calceolata.AAC.14
MKTGNTAVNAAVQPRPLGSLQHGLRLRPASLKRRPTVPAAAKSNDVDQGFSILTLTNKVFPQGAFVSGGSAAPFSMLASLCRLHTVSCIKPQVLHLQLRSKQA